MPKQSESLMRTFEASQGEMDPAQQILLLTMISQLSAMEQMIDEVRALRADFRKQGWR